MIPDLIYVPNYLSNDESEALIRKVDSQLWMSPFKRRVQHYGYQYDYKKRHVTEDMYLGTLPSWLQELATCLHNDEMMPALPDQVIVNEYYAGQGIAPHIDCEPCFGDTIASISLGSTCIMDFEHVQTQEKYHQVLHPNSLVVMQHEARYQWTHGIPARKSDRIEGIIQKRQRRLSLTFRTVILDYSK
ncbi:MAG: alpha-ketoglutarate-dependent dioxygenase AlkB [Chloroflexota bacterium]